MASNNGGQPIFKRVLLKLSGEFLANTDESMGIDPHKADDIAQKVKKIHDMGVEVAIVIGAGNLWRGNIGVKHGMDQATADYMGMIATVMNGMTLQDSLKHIGVDSRVQTAIEMNQVAEPYIRLRAIRHLEKGRVVILTGGTGNPFFTTDTAAALRCKEIKADLLIKATKVDGIYTADPKKDASAKRYARLNFMDAIQQQLRVMDTTAFTLCMDNDIPVVVLDFWQNGALEQAIRGEEVGTFIANDVVTVQA